MAEMTPPTNPLGETDLDDDVRTPSLGESASPLDDTLTPDAARRAPTRFGQPTKIGHYVLLERLGEGGMGVVVAAYDAKLDRRVAIKLIHAEHRDDNQYRLRLEREAQAMAKLSHPNVVTVHEVGEHDDQLFVVMEFVKGQNLREWLAQRKASATWRSILDMFVAAGEGLAAAHRANLVHRDFKPDNVFVGEDGRARVGDFGLVRGVIEEDQETLATRSQAMMVVAHERVLARSLTATGGTLGTPGYMAPEQFRARPTDARTDQFSFCVALWEALYGQRPFAGRTRAQVEDNVTQGKRSPPPAGKKVPTWVRKVLDRGLSIEPDARYPTTEAMLVALQSDPTRWRPAAVGVVAVVAAVVGWSGVQNHREAQQVAACEDEGASIETVWNADARTKLRDGLLASGAAYAQSTAERVLPYVDAQAQAWKQARTQVCLDTRVRGKWDEDTLDRSVWCLTERRMELEALLAQLTDADSTSVQDAVAAAAGLSSVDSCQDAQRLKMLPPLPADRAGVEPVQRLLSRADALGAAGKYEAGLAVVTEALASAEQLDWLPLTALARLRHGSLLASAGNHEEAENALEAAYFQAAEIGALEVAAEAALGLVFTVGYEQARHDEGIRWSRHAEVALATLEVEEDSILRSAAHNALALVFDSMGEYAEAKALHERALAIDEKLLGANHPSISIDLSNIALTHRSLGEYEQAKALHQRVLAIEQQALGREHPYIGTSLNNLALVHDDLGEYEEAQALQEQALAIRERALGPEHREVANSLNNLAILHKTRGDYEQAIALNERALAIRKKSLGPEHPSVATSLNNIAYVHLATGAYEQARPLLEAALVIYEKPLGPEHTLIAGTLSGLAIVHRTMGRFDEALALQARALSMREKLLGSEHPQVAGDLANLALIHAAMGASEPALALHQRALAIREQALGPVHPDVANSLNNLGVIQHSMGEPDEAKPLFERALAIYEHASGPEHPRVAYPLIGLAQIALDEKRWKDAVALAERGVQIHASSSAPPERLATGRFVLAQALWDAPEGHERDRARALALARQARDGLAQQPGTVDDLARVQAFLAAHADVP